MTASIDIVAFSAAELEAHIATFAALLKACVEDGASIGFVLPFSLAEAESYWRKKVLPGLGSGGLVLLVARQGDRIVGTVQLDHDTFPNQRHRGEVRKLMVHPKARRRGIATLLMQAVEKRAAMLGRSLITLDTRTGDGAEPLYLSLGYRVAGMIPGYCRDNIAERYDPTTIMYKPLGPHFPGGLA
ncbi:MAG TPA: GNAT family N-acetyltransferase [Alphaproteobacteria bacterium]|nr:GNAT family N-acetyltransferase [Alphaproteobacteria bacterium]